ncbi:NAD/NADP octopine/nopaline dehydrogenase family protein [Paenibacillus lutrae]|uniref:NAD(P)-binding protein n=1 Tax=Paenibacillus lutrae TaxID=2078573 RepID=A0A7X3FI61_9BACL|nr:NAD/NADP octopine/nopaline dehydrogenase family protein [Paenibacillus lutrae]MVP00118.1 NAD(P)-binding protein [Paenibacillus lutrae]
MNVTRVAILGAGNGGITAAADLKAKGFEIALFEMPEFGGNLDGIRKQGGILLQDTKGEAFYEVDVVTTDLEEAIRGAQIVMLTVPGFAIELFAGQLAPLVSEEQVILLNGAAAMGCVRFVNKARELGIQKEFKIAETNSLTYGTRAFPGEARVELSLRVKKLFFAAYPHENSKELLAVCSQIYDCFVLADNIWHTTLENGNPEVHPGPSLLNAGRIDYSEGEFWLYREGITEHTVKVLRAIERERMAIGQAFGFQLEDAVQSRARRGYFRNEEEDLQTLFNTSEVFTQIKGPHSVKSRYFTEDISSGLVLWSDLGKAAGVPTPNIDAVIVLGGSLLDTDFYRDGLTLQKLGFEGYTFRKLIESV